MNLHNLNLEIVSSLAMLFIICLSITMLTIIFGLMKGFDRVFNRYTRRSIIAVWVIFIIMIIIALVLTGGLFYE